MCVGIYACIYMEYANTHTHTHTLTHTHTHMQLPRVTTAPDAPFLQYTTQEEGCVILDILTPPYDVNAWQGWCFYFLTNLRIFPTF
jgi:hypothetical protein